MSLDKTLLAFDSAVTLVLVLSVVSLLALAAGHFDAIVVVFLSVLIGSAFVILCCRRNLFPIYTGSGKLFLPVLLLVVVAAVLRYDPYAWIAGAQDQGTYVNMSRYFQDTGSVFGTDETRESLPADYRAQYDRTNYEVGKIVNGEMEGMYLPGVYLRNQEESAYVFQFYHLQPLWMAIFGEVFGDTNRFFSTVFFGLLSIIAFYLLALEFTGSSLLAWSAGLLLALNPLHAFFSKYPVTEVTALAFSSLSFYYLLRYYNQARSGQYRSVLLAMSSVSIACMFFTRISGFMYLPFFYLLLLVLELSKVDRMMKKQLRIYLFSVFLLYLLSVLYGVKFSYPYTLHIYQMSFSRIFGEQWQVPLLLVCCLAAVAYLLVVFYARRGALAVLNDTLSRGSSLLPYVFLVFLLLGGYKVYQLGFTSELSDHRNYGVRWDAAGTGWRSLLYWSPVVLVEYLSPFIAVLFAYVVFVSRKNLPVERQLFLVFILLFFAYICILKWFIPYQYYYARYLLSEMLPYTLLFAVTGIALLPARKTMAYALVILGGVYMVALSSTQFRGKELDGFKQSLDELAKHIEPGETLLTGGRWLYSAGATELKTPLTFYYNYKVLSTDAGNGELFIDHFCESQQYVYYLGGDETQGLGSPYRRINFQVELFERQPYVPTRVVQASQRHSLFRINCKGWNRYRANDL